MLLQLKKTSTSDGLVRKGVWAVMDQGLFAGSNCLVNVLLARWLSQHDFGAFSTAFNGFLLLGVIHTALLTEPMLVFAADRYRGKLSHYLGALARGHVIISGAASLILAAVGIGCAARGQASLAGAFFCFAVSGPFTLFLWLMRRACYAQFNPRRAAMAGIGYLVLIVIGLTAMHQFGHLSVPWATGVIGAASFVVGLWLAIGGHTVRPLGLEPALLRDVAAIHWRYGKWATATAVLGFVPGNFYYFILPKLATLEQSGALQALNYLYNPFSQANAALCLLLLPAFVRQRGTAEGRRTHKLALLVLAGGPLLYWIALGVFSHPVIHLVYNGKYDAYAPLMWIIGFQPVISGMCGVYGSLLRAHQKLNAVFWSGLVAAIASVSLGIGMTMKFGLAGVCWSIVISYALHHLTLWLFSREIKRMPKTETQTSPSMALA